MRFDRFTETARRIALGIAFGAAGLLPTPEQFRDFTRGEFERWRRLSNELGIRHEG